MNNEVKIYNRLELLTAIRNEQYKKQIAFEIDLRIVGKEIIMSANSKGAKEQLNLKNNIEAIKGLISIIDSLIEEEQKKGVAKS